MARRPSIPVRGPQTRGATSGEVVRKEPILDSGGIVVLKGNLAPDGALIKVAGLKNLKFTGRARSVHD